MTETSTELLDILHELIGARGQYHAGEYELIEVLEHGPSLVLRDCSAAHEIQSDMHGEARRLVTKTHTVPLFSEVHDELHPVLKEFFGDELSEKLSASIHR